MRASYRILGLRLAILALFFGAAFAQVLGTLNGEVLPPPGEQVPAIIMVRLSGFDFDQTTHAVSGRFTFQGVRSGNYLLTVSAEGRKSVTTELRSWSTTESASRLCVELGDRIADPTVDLKDSVVDVKTLKVPDSARRELAKANELQAKADYEEALAHIDKALKICPLYYQAYNNRGVVYTRINRLDEAEKAFAKSVELESESALSQKNLGLIRLSLGKHKEAIVPLSKAANLNSNDAETKAYLGEAMFLEGRIEEARDLLEAALVLRPDLEAANYRLGHIYMDSGHSDEALKFFRHYLKQNSGKAVKEVETVVAQLEQKVR